MPLFATRRALAGAAAGLIASPALPRAAAAQDAPLQLGVMPNVSARILMGQYQSVRGYLAEQLGRQVEVVTAPGLQPFQERSLAGAYGVVVTAANLGRVAQLDAGLRPVAIYEPRIPGLLVTHRDHPVADLRTLRGRQVAMTNPQSLVALRFQHWLRAETGLVVGQDVQGLHSRNEDSLAQLLGGQATPVAVMSRGEFNAIRPEIRDTLVVRQEFERVPGFWVLLARDMPPAEAAAIEAALTRFGTTDAARQFFQATGFTAVRPITAADIAELDSVVEETRRLLARS